MLVTGKYILKRAYKKGYAVGAFNINNMEICQAVINAANTLKSPVLLQTSEGAIKYAGLDYLYAIARVASDTAKVPVTIHLDHGKDWKIIKACINKGYTSVMFDGSHYKFKENVRLTKRVVEYAHKKGVSVEAELGTIGGVEDLVSARKIIYTDPDAAVEFVEKQAVTAWPLPSVPVMARTSLRARQSWTSKGYKLSTGN